MEGECISTPSSDSQESEHRVSFVKQNLISTFNNELSFKQGPSRIAEFKPKQPTFKDENIAPDDSSTHMNAR